MPNLKLKLMPMPLTTMVDTMAIPTDTDMVLVDTMVDTTVVPTDTVSDTATLARDPLMPNPKLMPLPMPTMVTTDTDSDTVWDTVDTMAVLMVTTVTDGASR